MVGPIPQIAVEWWLGSRGFGGLCFLGPLGIPESGVEHHGLPKDTDYTPAQLGDEIATNDGSQPRHCSEVGEKAEGDVTNEMGNCQSRSEMTAELTLRPISPLGRNGGRGGI